MSSRLVLGTAQLGSSYGINNVLGQPSIEQAKAIVGEAYRLGINEFDTAQAYGSSEKVLGDAITALGINGHARVVSKFNPSLEGKSAGEWIAAAEGSLGRLGVKQLECLMLHRESQMTAWPVLYQDIKVLKNSGQTASFGVSVYDPKEGLKALKMDGIERVQIPANILDRRFEEAGFFALAEKLGKTVYVRSVYLQGLLLMEPHQVPSPLGYAVEAVKQIGKLAERFRLNVWTVCLGYVLAKWPRAKIIVGAESPHQVFANAAIERQQLPDELIKEADNIFLNVSEDIVNPLRWPKIV